MNSHESESNALANGETLKSLSGTAANKVSMYRFEDSTTVSYSIVICVISSLLSIHNSLQTIESRDSI